MVKVLHAGSVEGVQSLAKFEGLLAVSCYMTTCHLVYRYPSFLVSRSEHFWSSPGVTLRGIVVDPKDLISRVLRNVNNYQKTWRRIPQGLKYGVRARGSSRHPTPYRHESTEPSRSTGWTTGEQFSTVFRFSPPTTWFAIQSGCKAAGTVV
jgi:hypothetical protein